MKLRHVARTPKLSIASLEEARTSWRKLIQTPTKEQLGDYFTKSLPPGKFDVSVLGLYRVKQQPLSVTSLRVWTLAVATLVAWNTHSWMSITSS